MHLPIKKIEIFRVDLKDHSLSEAKELINSKGYFVLKWEREDDISSRIYYAYCVKKEESVYDRSNG